MPALADAEPEPITHFLGSSAIRRFARIDLPLPGPPQSSRKNETSWNGSNAWQCISSMSLTSRPAMRVLLEKRCIRKAR